MKYTIDLETNTGFIQFVGLAEYGEIAAEPAILQVRGGICTVDRLKKLIDRVIDRNREIEETYHDNLDSRNYFNYGYVEFEAGSVPLTCIVHQREVTLMIGTRKFGTRPIDLEDFSIAVDRCILDYEAQQEAYEND